MNIKSLIRLPWKLKDVFRSMRRDLAESRRMMAEILEMTSDLEPRLRETLVGEFREQGLLMATAARYSSRAAAEMKLRNRLPPPLSRRRCERPDHLLEPCRVSGPLGCECRCHA